MTDLGLTHEQICEHYREENTSMRIRDREIRLQTIREAIGELDKCRSIGDARDRLHEI